jgi:hypothetical protein
MKALALAFLAAACTGCIVYPKKVSFYDEDCHVTAHQLTLDAELFWGDCRGNTAAEAEACLLIIAGSGVASAVISGSIVVVGNTLYWLEKQDRCERRDIAGLHVAG